MQAEIKPPTKDRLQGLLAHVPLFRDLSPEELARIAAGTTEVRAERGKLLFNRGDPCVGFHVVVFGQVKITVNSPAGAEKVLDIIGPGMSFGEALMFMDRPYIVFAEALADSLLLHISKSVLFAELDRDPSLAKRMLAGLSWRLRMMVHDLEALTLHSASQRVIGYLLRLEDDAGGPRVTLPTQKSLLASRLNLTPEYFSRILHELATAGMISVEGRDIQILDGERLRAHGAEGPGR